VAVLSFGGSKLLTAGRGGALLTRRADVYQRVKIFSRRGNEAFALSELQAAVLIPQLARLDQRNAQRRAAAERLAARLRQLDSLTPLANRAENSQPAYYKLGMKYNAQAVGGATRESFVAAAQAEGLALGAGFPGFVLRSHRRCRHVGPLENSRQASSSMLVLHHPVLLEPPEVIDRVADCLAKVEKALR
jgi:dTDP-4-amino-4,6-dideoxygalactose transaminase